MSANIMPCGRCHDQVWITELDGDGLCMVCAQPETAGCLDCVLADSGICALHRAEAEHTHALWEAIRRLRAAGFTVTDGNGKEVTE